MNNLAHVCLSSVIVLAIAFFAALLGSERIFDAQIDESADIVSATWDASGQKIREQVAELRRPETNDGVWRWRPGWNAERLSKEYDRLVNDGK